MALWLLLWPGATQAAGTSSFPTTQVLGWTTDGALASLTFTELGRGEVVLHRAPPLRIPVKPSGLCGDAPRWACRLELDPRQPEAPATEWVARVRQELGLQPSIPGSPPRADGRLRYAAPGGFWVLEASDEAQGYFPTVELVLAGAPGERRYLAWQATFPLHPDEPLRLEWCPGRPRAALLAQTADRPRARVELVARVDLNHPIEVEERALAQLAAVLERRPASSVRLSALVEQVRSRSQRRVELGSILAENLEAACHEGEVVGTPVLLDAESFDWSEQERGALLAYGCPAATAPQEGRLLVSYSLQRRFRGRWEVLRQFPGTPTGELELRQIDLTQDGNAEIWLRQADGQPTGRYLVLGWRDRHVDELLQESYRTGCVPGAEPGTFVQEVPELGDPDGKGTVAVLLRRTVHTPPAGVPDSARCQEQTGRPARQEQVLWRWNSRLKRFFRRELGVPTATATKAAAGDFTPPTPTLQLRPTDPAAPDLEGAPTSSPSLDQQFQ